MANVTHMQKTEFETPANTTLKKKKLMKTTTTNKKKLLRIYTGAAYVENSMKVP